MKKNILIILVAFCVLYTNAQSQQELATKYLKERGELAFTFKANSIEEIQALSKIVSFDHGQNTNNPLTINAIANPKSFQNFLAFNLPFTINKALNEPKDVVMFDPKIHKKGVSGKNAAYPLAFPLTAYPTYQQYVSQMTAFATDHPSIARLENIGTTPGSAAGSHELLFIVLSDNVASREAEPRIMYTSSIHGDEIAGYPMMLSLIDYLINAYNDTGNPDHTRIKNLLDNSEIWINPLANPDGTYRTSNTSVSSAIRGNANGIDMNRNYPEPEGSLHPDGNAYQSETIDFMNLADTYHFVLSANFHGGAEVVNYPWDFTYDRHIDDTWLVNISKEYADNAQADGPPGYFTSVTSTGYSHGADWYLIAGGRQDYMTYEKHGREITMEISDTKLIPANQIQNHWNYNREALLDYLVQGTYGFKGIVKDASNNNPIKAKITIIGRDDQALSRNSWAETEMLSGQELGDYYRPIDAGTYDILYEADCYESFTLSNQTIANYQTINLADVLLNPITTSMSLSNLAASSISVTTATLNWNGVKNASNFDIRYREVGSSTWINSTSSTNYLDITGLSATTNYEFQVRVTCGSITSQYSASQTFTTTAIPPCTGEVFSDFVTGYSESFESDYGYWTNSTSDDIQWTRDSGGTPSSNTGPSTGSDGNWYLYTEASLSQGSFPVDGNPNKNAELISPCFDLTGYKDAQFTFNYHWYGSNISTASLSVEVSIDNGLNYTSLFTKTGSSSNSWVSQLVDLSAYDGEIIKIKISGTTGNGYASDMAIDNITLTATVDSSLGTQDQLLSEFLIYPNPVANGEINLKIPNQIQQCTVAISNMLGQKLIIEEVDLLNKHLHTLKTNGLKSGIYFITVSTNLGKATKKIILQ
jgi:hypothetical protein